MSSQKDTTFLVSRRLDYKSIKSLALINKENYNVILQELEHYFKMLPEYIRRDREFKKHYNSIFIALQSIYPNSNLYDILVYLQSKEFEELKRKTDEYIKKEGLKKTVLVYFKNKGKDFINISLFDTRGIKDMSKLFYREPADKYLWINSHNLNLWDVSSVENMSKMFVFQHSFTSPLNLWDVSNVKNMSRMFEDCEFNQSINSWDVSNVKDMSYMFYQSKFNRPINSWNVSNVKDMSYMFCYSNRFNQPLDSWNVSNVKDMSHMFKSAFVFNQPINSWDVSNVKDMSHMFDQAINFNKPLDSWDISNVENMEEMFREVETFKQPLNMWVVNNSTNMKDMFLYADHAKKIKKPQRKKKTKNTTRAK